MWIRTGLLLVWTLSFASSVLALHAEDASPVKFSVASTRDEAAADKNDKHPSNSPGGRRHHAREIVEISDPTTDSTLHLPQYPIDCTNNKECDLIGTDTTPMPTFRPYTQEELNGFLKKYVANNRQIPGAEQPTNKLANIYMEETVNVLENGEDSGKSQEKSKSWQLMQGSPHKNSYDDKTGWVTLEPVPWSASQIQKWEPNKRPPVYHSGTKIHHRHRGSVRHRTDIKTNRGTTRTLTFTGRKTDLGVPAVVATSTAAVQQVGTATMLDQVRRSSRETARLNSRTIRPGQLGTKGRRRKLSTTGRRKVTIIPRTTPPTGMDSGSCSPAPKVTRSRKEVEPIKDRYSSRRTPHRQTAHRQSSRTEASD